MFSSTSELWVFPALQPAGCLCELYARMLTALLWGNQTDLLIYAFPSYTNASSLASACSEHCVAVENYFPVF